VDKPDFFTFLSRSLELLQHEAPDGYAVVRERLGKRSVRLDVEGKVLDLRLGSGGHQLAAREGTAAIELRTSRDLVVALVEARTSLLTALESDDLLLRGAPEDLIALHDALVAYVRAAVRSYSMPRLLEAFLSAPPKDRDGLVRIGNEALLDGEGSER